MAVIGFNLEVEGALVAALPLLIISRWRLFPTLRVGMMPCTALLAGVWVVERAREPTVAVAAGT